ncbi:MAG: hypothetical protein GX664_03935 [Bacteroidales bacterium]|nr:hypothetical protein [Bacteroidales bacterium]
MTIIMSDINYKQLGVSGLRRYGGYVYEEFISDLRWPRAGKVYQEMANNDPVIGSILYLAEMMIRNADWSVEAAGDRRVDKQAAEFLESCMHDMDTSWADTICEILSVLTYGFSFHEIVYKVRRGPNETDGRFRSKYTDGRIGWRRIPVRAQTSLHEWIFDEDGDIKGFVQIAPPDYKKVVIPLSKGLLFRTSVQRDNPEGKSLLRNAYRPWYFKKRIEEIEGIGIERDLAGLPVLQAPDGLDLWNSEDERMAALRKNAEELVRSIRRDSEEGVLLPHGWELKLLSTGSARQFDTNAIINRYDNRIAITMLSDLILIGSEKTGSFAMASTKQSLLSSALEAQLASIAEVFNKYAVPKLFQLNTFRGLVDYPRIVPGQIETPSLKEIALLLRAMGVDISNDMPLMNYLRKIADLPQMDEKTFEEVYKPQARVNNQSNKPKDQFDDTVENDFEQNDLAYTGQEL